jgi:hypothetical protein
MPTPITGRQNVVLSLALGALALSAATLLNAQAAADPRTGVWEEQRTSTHFESIRRVVEDAPGGMTRMIINAKLDEPNRQHVDFRCDGKPYPILAANGSHTGMTYSCHRAGSRGLDSVIATQGASVGVETTVSEVVSEDGKRLSMTISAGTPDHRVEQTRREFVRQASN